jgi:hypothetical protein
MKSLLVNVIGALVNKETGTNLVYDERNDQSY